MSVFIPRPNPPPRKFLSCSANLMSKANEKLLNDNTSCFNSANFCLTSSMVFRLFTSNPTLMLYCCRAITTSSLSLDLYSSIPCAASPMSMPSLPNSVDTLLSESVNLACDSIASSIPCLYLLTSINTLYRAYMRAKTPADIMLPLKLRSICIGLDIKSMSFLICMAILPNMLATSNVAALYRSISVTDASITLPIVSQLSTIRLSAAMVLLMNP